MRNLENVSTETAKKSGWKIVKELKCELIGKAVYKKGKEAIMKSTKRFPAEGGYIYNTTTEYHKGSQVTIAEAITFVPSNIPLFRQS